MSLRTVLETHEVPGAVALVALGEEVELEAVGNVREDSLFRIASVTKPITAAAVMLLVDDGAVGLDDPVGRWLPELADPVVLRDPAGHRARRGSTTRAQICRGARQRVSGRPLPEFMEERIFAPLGMGDTAFVVPTDKLHRLAPLQVPETLPPVIGRERWDLLPAVPSGAGGLASTAADLLAFERMLLANGEPLLSEQSVLLMRTDHLTPSHREASTVFLEGEGWGFGGAVAASGRYGWIGGSGTAAHIDPARGTAAILLTQVPMTGPAGTPLLHDFWHAAGI